MCTESEKQKQNISLECQWTTLDLERSKLYCDYDPSQNEMPE